LGISDRRKAERARNQLKKKNLRIEREVGRGGFFAAGVAAVGCCLAKKRNAAKAVSEGRARVAIRLRRGPRE
jgi:hypothetical protein